MDVAMVEEEVKDMAGTEAESWYDITILFNYLVHMGMELLFLKLIYMIKVNINHFSEIN